MSALLDTRHNVVCPQLTVADRPRARMKGLLGRRSLAPGEGLLLKPAGSVHTAFMRFPIDVVFLDRSMQVLRVEPSVGPWRMTRQRGARAVLEMASGAAERNGIAAGMSLGLAERSGDEDAEGWHWSSSSSAVPILTAATMGMSLALARFGFSSRGLVAACFLAALAALALIDFREHLIPNRIVLPSAALVLGLQLALFPDGALEWLGASAGCFLVLLVPALIKPGGLGMGDVKLGLLLGAGLGLQAATAMLIGFIALWPIAVWILLHDGSGARGQALPLGPALALGALLVTLTG